MHPILLMLVTLWSSSAFYPGALMRQLAAAERGDLPVAFGLDASLPLRIAFHTDPRLDPARYVQADARGPARLDLYAPYYLRGVHLRPVEDMQVDVCEPYFHALLDAYLRRQIGMPRSALGHELRRRAELAMPDVPRRHRVEAYLDAQASFGAHLLSVANELDRSARRHRARGRSLCHVIDRPLPLLRLWNAVLGGAQYPGAYAIDTAPGNSGEVYLSRSVLSVDDKRFLVDQVLHEDWSGSVERDLAPRLCG
jgi:hypothetical protein